MRNFFKRAGKRTADYADEFYENLRDKDNPATKDLILSQHFRMPENNIKHINSNMIVIGAPGSGKTQCIVKPNLLQMDGNYVVLDYGGELMCDTKKTVFGCRIPRNGSRPWLRLAIRCSY